MVTTQLSHSHSYDRNPAHELIQKVNEEIERKQERLEEVVENGEEDVDFHEDARQKRRRRRRRKSSTRSGAGGRLVKRPSLLSVLGGRQWSDELDKMSKCLVKRCLDFISFFFMQLLLALHSKILLDAVSA